MCNVLVATPLEKRLKKLDAVRGYCSKVLNVNLSDSDCLPAALKDKMEELVPKGSETSKTKVADSAVAIPKSSPRKQEGAASAAGAVSASSAAGSKVRKFSLKKAVKTAEAEP